MKKLNKLQGNSGKQFNELRDKITFFTKEIKILKKEPNRFWSWKA